MVGVDNGRACRGIGRGVATALHGALRLRLGEPPQADLCWDDHLRCGGRGGAIGAQPSGAGRSTSRALVTAGRWGVGALHKVLTVLYRSGAPDTIRTCGLYLRRVDARAPNPGTTHLFNRKNGALQAPGNHAAACLLTPRYVHGHEPHCRPHPPPANRFRIDRVGLPRFTYGKKPVASGAPHGRALSVRAPSGATCRMPRCRSGKKATWQKMAASATAEATCEQQREPTFAPTHKGYLESDSRRRAKLAARGRLFQRRLTEATSRHSVCVQRQGELKRGTVG